MKNTYKKGKKLRREPSSTFVKLKNIIKTLPLSLSFSEHHPFGDFLADIYFQKQNLIIVIDGNKEKNTRIQFFEQQGIKVKRYSKEDIVKYPDMIQIELLNEL
jgi:very-short-patch-repair endonuclease